jgi:large subunit ribosomal protein L41e
MIRHARTHSTKNFKKETECSLQENQYFSKNRSANSEPTSNFRLLDELLGGSRVEESALHFEKHREMRAKWKKKRTRRLKRKRRKMRQRSK